MDNSTIYAPDLPRGLPWLNTPRALTLRDLRGRLVVMHFWTASGFDCASLIRTLREFEQRHRDEPVVVIGVHSARFDGEREPERVEDAVRRLDVRHPVLVDSDLAVWRSYGADRWPTLVVVRPDSTIAALSVGEPSLDALERLVADELRRARDKGQLTEVPLQYLADPTPASGPLCFPMRVAAGPDGRLAVSNAGGRRVLVFSPDGSLSAVIGTGEATLRDGPIGEAAFVEPTGLVFASDGALYVADAGAHAIRRVDLVERRVSTIAGKGEPGDGPLRKGRAPATTVSLKAPYGLAIDGATLHVALAGSNQIASIDTRSGELRLLAGSGEQGIKDGPADASSFAGPTGLSVSGRSLFVADSENSAIRRVDLDKGEVETVVGTGSFDFGFEDGPKSRALLQRPLDVVASPDGSKLFVIDTLNHRVREVSAQTGETRSLSLSSGQLELREPSGACLSATKRSLLVADSSNHRLLEVPLDGGAPRVLDLGPVPDAGAGAKGAVWVSPSLTQPLAVRDGDSTLTVRLLFPQGYTPASDAPNHAHIEVERRGDLVTALAERVAFPAGGPIAVSLRVGRSHRPVEAELLLRLEMAGREPGQPRRLLVRLPLRLGQGGPAEPSVEVPVRSALD